MSLLNTLIEALPLQPPQQALVAGAMFTAAALVLALWIDAQLRRRRLTHRSAEVRVPPPL